MHPWPYFVAMTSHHSLPVDKATGEALSPIRKRRVSAKVRQALSLRLREALPWAECAERAGMSEAGLHKARNQPHVKALFKEMEGQYIQEVEALKAPHKARALEVARHLLDNSTSDTVKARMVEFFAGEPKGAGVNVAVQVNNHQPADGYEYVRPGQVVEIVDAVDTTSPVQSGQVDENKG